MLRSETSQSSKAAPNTSSWFHRVLHESKFLYNQGMGDPNAPAMLQTSHFQFQFNESALSNYAFEELSGWDNPFREERPWIVPAECDRLKPSANVGRFRKHSREGECPLLSPTPLPPIRRELLVEIRFDTALLCERCYRHACDRDSHTFRLAQISIEHSNCRSYQKTMPNVK